MTPPGTTPPGTAPRSTPQDVITAFQLWWVAAAFGLAQLVCAMISALGERDEIIDQLLADMARRDPELVLSRATAELFVFAGLVIAVVIGIVLAAVVLLIAYQMRRGRPWARTVLTMLGSILVVFAVPALFGLGTATGAVGMLTGALAILGGVAAAGAIFLMHRKDSNTYFLSGPRVR
jgi:hypothetical protein